MIRNLVNFKMDPLLFGIFRIFFGLFFLIYFLMYSNRWMELYGPHGISPIKLLNQFNFYRPSILAILHSELALWTYYVFIILMTFCLILGRLGKWPAFFIWLTLISISNSNPSNVNAEEYSLTIFAFYLMIMPTVATLVFSFKERRFIDSKSPVYAWSLIPFLLHMELIYVISLPLKPIIDHSWIDGNLTYFATHNFDISRYPGPGIMRAYDAIVSKILTWLSLIVEGIFPFLVWSKRYKVLAIVSMVGFQVGIAVMLAGVQVFSLSMLIALALFLPPDSTREFFHDPKPTFIAWCKNWGGLLKKH